jgi:hypothetical protein
LETVIPGKNFLEAINPWKQKFLTSLEQKFLGEE